MNYNDKVNNVRNFLNGIEEMVFGSEKDFYKFCGKEIEWMLWAVSPEDLNEEFQRANECGYCEEEYVNPFKVGSPNYWMSQGWYEQGASDC